MRRDSWALARASFGDSDTQSVGAYARYFGTRGWALSNPHFVLREASAHHSFRWDYALAMAAGAGVRRARQWW